MYILENIDWIDKPEILVIKKSEKIKQFAVALGKNAVLKKHKTSNPTTLIVLKGEIKFEINNEIHHFKTFETYEIPINIEHEVLGLQTENLFLLTQEL